MNHKDRLRTWVAALRSGEFPQGHGNLERGGQFCCLGVLCATLEAEGELSSAFYPESRVRTWGDSQGAYLPPVRASQLLGLVDPNITVMYRGARTELWRLNDLYRLSFDQIADLIEKEFEL